MAQFEGAYPVDQSTPIGMFRTEIGDDVGTPIAPGNTTATYLYFSDAGLQGLLDAFPDTPELAVGTAMKSVAMKLILAAQDIQVDDIKIKTIEKARLMMEFAQDMLDRGGLSGASAAFSVVPLISGGYQPVRPEGTPEPWPSL